MYSAFKEFYNLLSQVNSVYHDAALKLGLTDSELDILYSLNEHGSGCNQSIFYKETGTTKSTITPWRIGRITSIFDETCPVICLASSPIAFIFSEFLS